jgi:hypothetical protein
MRDILGGSRLDLYTVKYDWEIRAERERVELVKREALHCPIVHVLDVDRDTKRQRRFDQPLSHELAGELLRSSVSVER